MRRLFSYQPACSPLAARSKRGRRQSARNEQEWPLATCSQGSLLATRRPGIASRRPETSTTSQSEAYIPSWCYRICQLEHSRRNSDRIPRTGKPTTRSANKCGITTSGSSHQRILERLRSRCADRANHRPKQPRYRQPGCLIAGSPLLGPSRIVRIWSRPSPEIPPLR